MKSTTQSIRFTLIRQLVTYCLFVNICKANPVDFTNLDGKQLVLAEKDVGLIAVTNRTLPVNSYDFDFDYQDTGLTTPAFTSIEDTGPKLKTNESIFHSPLLCPYGTQRIRNRCFKIVNI